MSFSQKNSSQAVNAAERRTKALDLRKQGLTYEAIGKELGCNRSRAYKIVSKELSLIKAKNNETAEEIKTIELQRLDHLLEATMIRAVDENTKDVYLPAVDRCLRIMERRAKLLGLDSPEKLDVETKQQLVINLVRKSCRKEDNV
jgi:intein-encoded DNA endonuclease-like protein